MIVNLSYLTYLFAQSRVAERPCRRHHSAGLVGPEVRGQLLRWQLGGPGQRREGLEVRGQSRDLDRVLQLAEKLGTAQLGPAGHTAGAGELDPVLIHRLTEIQDDDQGHKRNNNLSNNFRYKNIIMTV